MVSEQDEVLIQDSVAPDDCELLKLAFLSASEGSTLLDMSSLTKPDIHGYVVVLKHLLGNCQFHDTGANIRIYCFFRGHGNESCNLIGSLPGQYFPISAHGPR